MFKYCSIMALMISTGDILNIFLAVFLVVITGCIVYVTYYLVQALKSISTLSESLEQTSQNIREKIQMKALALIPALVISLARKLIQKRR